MDCTTTGESPGERGCILQPDKKDPGKGKIKTNGEALDPSALWLKKAHPSVHR